MTDLIPRPVNDLPDLSFLTQGWREYALCTGLDFIEPEDVESCKHLCSQCPVRIECLDDAMNSGVPLGVRGGLSEQEQIKLKNFRSHTVMKMFFDIDWTYEG